MNPYRFLGLCALGYVALIGIFGHNTTSTTNPTTSTAPVLIEYAPVTTWETLPSTTSSTTTSSTPQPTTTLPQLVDYDTPCQEWVDEALAAGWPADRQIITRLMGLVFRESRCTPQIVSPSGDHGLAQINGIHRAYVEQIFGEPFEQAMSDPIKNLHFAWLLYSEREADNLCGWSPWRLSC